MKIHHINCGSFCPQVKGLSGISHCHCLLIETKKDLILIDTGINKSLNPSPTTQIYNIISGVDSDKFLSAEEQVIRLGFSPKDVSHILVTHLDSDHAGGIPDFKNATLHVSKTELTTANKTSSLIRYQKKLWKNHTNILTYDTYGDTWNGFNAIKNIPGVPEEILMIPLPGHTPGHTGFAIKSKDSWLFHVGDAYFSHLELVGNIKSLPYKAFSRINCFDNKKRLENLKKIKTLKEKNNNISIFNSHDTNDFNKLKKAR